MSILIFSQFANFGNQSLSVTQNRCNAIFTVASKLLNGQEKAQKTQHSAAKANQETITIDEEISNLTTSTSNYAPLDRIPLGANHDGTHNDPKVQDEGSKTDKATTKTYANTTKANLPPGAAPEGQKYNHKQNNKGSFDPNTSRLQ